AFPVPVLFITTASPSFFPPSFHLFFFPHHRSQNALHRA
ncbi:unnamed protein product, partial [Brassica rapa subsp. trilocularis]